MSTLGAIAGYQQVNNFYANSLRIDTPERIQEETAAQISSETQPTDDNAAFASISPEAIALYEAEQTGESTTQAGGEQTDGEQTSGEQTGAGTNQELTPQEQQQLAELKQTDAQVKAHEHAHKSTAAGLTTSGPNYEYETGPDGKKYAVAGDVNVSYQKSSDPEVNLKNAQQLKAAALAPADPSSQDRKVAMQADREIAQARQEIMEEQNQTEEEEETSGTSAAGSMTPASETESDTQNNEAETTSEA